MAFTYEDTDKLYDRVICDVLGQRNIAAVRIDRLIHNDDVDDRIIREIKGSDFLIADLTYARPSVYYEAGYAEREIPVIYTIRRDHLKARAEDKFGNLRLHFDLQMKNVIESADAGDEIFHARLGDRIDAVVAPLRKKSDSEGKEAADKAAFQSLPIEGRIAAIMKAAALVLPEMGFVAASESREKFGCEATSFRRKVQGQDAFYVRAEEGALSSVELSVHTKTGDVPFHWIRDEPYFNLNLSRTIDRINKVRELKIECAFVAIPFLEVCHKMSKWSANPDRKHLMIESVLDFPVFNPGSVGDVFASHEYFWDSLFSGSNRHDGFCVGSVPPGMLSRSSSQPGLTFAYGAYKVRKVPRRIEYQIIDEIDSMASFTRRLKASLESV